MAKESEQTKVAVLQEQMETVGKNIESISKNLENINAKLDGVYVKKDDYNPVNLDKEMRLRRLETWGAIAIGLMYALEFYFNFLHK